MVTGATVQSVVPEGLLNVCSIEEQCVILREMEWITPSFDPDRMKPGLKEGDILIPTISWGEMAKKLREVTKIRVIGVSSLNHQAIHQLPRDPVYGITGIGITPLASPWKRLKREQGFGINKFPAHAIHVAIAVGLYGATLCEGRKILCPQGSTCRDGLPVVSTKKGCMTIQCCAASRADQKVEVLYFSSTSTVQGDQS